MPQHRLLALATLTVAFSFGGSTLHAQKVYWIDSGTLQIHRSNLDGSAAEVVLAAELASPGGIALDIASGKMYWTDSGLRKIERANLDGTGRELLANSGASTGLALDLAAGKMYWTSGNRVMRADLDGSAAEQLVSVQSPATFGGIALDVSAGKMYWTNIGSDRSLGDEKIQRANLDGSMVEDLLATVPGAPWGIALDVAAGKMYWADFRADVVQRANLDGSGVEDFVLGANSGGITLDLPAGKLYWTDAATGSIHRTDLITAADDTLASGLGALRGIAIDPAAGKMYLANDKWAEEKIQRADLDGSNVEDLVLNTTGFVIPWELAVDGRGGKLYWSDVQTYKLHRANLDGSGVETIIANPTGRSPHGVSLDVPRGKIYWTESQVGVRRANLDGSSVENLTPGTHSPLGIDLDLAGGKMYWIDTISGGDLLTRIYRANLDGSSLEAVLVIEPTTVDIAVDAAGGKFYWTDAHNFSIKRANLDGTNVEDLPIVDIAHDPFSIDLDVAAGKMYWTSWANPGRVRRANLDGTGVEDLATTTVMYGHGIALDFYVGPPGLPAAPIPAVSEWGVIVMALLLAAAGTSVLRKVQSA